MISRLSAFGLRYRTYNLHKDSNSELTLTLTLTQVHVHVRPFLLNQLFSDKEYVSCGRA